MSEQASNLRGAAVIVRRHKFLVGFLAGLGIVCGVAYAFLTPPTFTSSALVLLPASPTMTSNVETEVVIASSDPVLIRALPSIRPAMSLSSLSNAITVTSETTTLLTVTASTRTAGGAESAANAVAKSFVDYLSDSGGPIGHVSSEVLQLATTATGKNRLTTLLIDLLVGVAAGAVLGILVALGLGREDRRLRARDAIANSIGVPVLASLPVAHPRDAADWTDLLRQYKPEPVHAWRLRRALQLLGLPDGTFGYAERAGSSAITVLSLSSDPGALALGPQLAAYAVSLGVPTALVVGPQDDEANAAALRVAGEAMSVRSSEEPAALKVITSSGGLRGWQRESQLAVVVTVIDSQNPRPRFVIDPTVTVLAVSSGVANAQQLARVAMTSADKGHEITAILVADPEATDTTTGQAPRLNRPARHEAPTRLSGKIMEIRR
jgi:capsular polysaccharide biosynthesis protein